MDRPCSICNFPDPFHHLADIQRKAVSLSDLKESFARRGKPLRPETCMVSIKGHE
jgi:hypothetical protein